MTRMAANTTATCQTARQALKDNRLESVRRICERFLRNPCNRPDQAQVLELLHEAYRRLGDFPAAFAVLQKLRDTAQLPELALCALEAEDCRLLADEGAYRLSKEKRDGLSVDEYLDKYRMRSRQALQQAEDLAAAATAPLPPELLALLQQARKRCGSSVPDTNVPSSQEQCVQQTPITGSAKLHGVLRDAFDTPLAGILLTLGLPATVMTLPPDTLHYGEMHYEPEILAAPTRTAITAADGSFEFAGLSDGCHEYLAAICDDEIGVHFLAHQIPISSDSPRELALRLTEWHSATTEANGEPRSTMPEVRNFHGVCARLVWHKEAANPFYYEFPPQAVHLALPEGIPASPRQLRLIAHDSDQEIPFQICGTELVFFAALPPQTRRAWGLYYTPEMLPASAALPSMLRNTPAGKEAGYIEVDTGEAAFRIGWNFNTVPSTSVDSAPTIQPPLLAVRAEDGLWRGTGRFVLRDTARIIAQNSQVLADGPVLLRLRNTYRFADGGSWSFTFTFYRGERTLLARETPAPRTGAFEFSLREFGGGRCYLHWNAETGSLHWTDLRPEERELARLQESVAWWIPPQGFACALCPPEGEDYLALFTVRRGEWRDEEFARLCGGPGESGRELDWPFPEMVGSTVSMLTAHTSGDGDIFWRFATGDEFAAFRGERQWGILASAFVRNDGPRKELSAVQHKNSAPRLEQFWDWELEHRSDLARPSLLTTRAELPGLRTKARSPQGAAVWEKVAAEAAKNRHTAFLCRALRAMVEKDPAELWRLKTTIAGVAHIRARMTLEGREFSDMYSPVGGRPITPWAETYDLIVATGVFAPAEERLTRSFLLLMGQLYQQEDFMNWRHGSRNANFEADRVDIVGAVALVFRDHPCAPAMIAHVTSLMERSLQAYCTPGSGKWYENPACYYLHAMRCRMNLAYHLYRHGIYDGTRLPRLKDYLAWGPLLLTPPLPVEYEALRQGCSRADYAAAAKARRVPPIGDHAHLGQWIGELFALIGDCYGKTDPELANFLHWAYEQGGAHGGYFNSLAPYFCALPDAPLPPARQPHLASRRLEGFGALFRDRVGQPDEFYLLFKLGPGGYRYHRTEGSILLFADGKPLLYDGGEAGETWRHTTLSFGEAHLPLAAGHIERFSTFADTDFAQGVNPDYIRPGEPVFLSDSCEHHLVDLAHTRFACPAPVNSRTVLNVRGDYLILHDELRLPAGDDTPVWWHLQAVSDRHELLSGPHDLRFIGRFGTDLQVCLPDQEFAEQRVTQDPQLEYHLPPEKTFSQRHLALRLAQPRPVIALLRPLPEGAQPLSAHAFSSGSGIAGIEVTGTELHDRHFLARRGMAYASDQVQFRGSYGSLLQRHRKRTLTLYDAGTLQMENWRLESEGPAVAWQLDDDGAFTLCACGNGRIRAEHGDWRYEFRIRGESTLIRGRYR